MAGAGAITANLAAEWAVARRFGRVLVETRRSGRVRFRIDFGTFDGTRHILGSTPTRTGGRIPFRDRQAAEEVLASIRADMLARRLSHRQVLALWFERGPAPEDLIEARAERYLARFRELVAEGQRSPTSLREIERYARPGGHWARWRGRASPAAITPRGNGRGSRWQRRATGARNRPDEA